MMKHIISFLLLMASLEAFPQTVQQIKESGEFYWGEGRGPSVIEARQQAQIDMLEKISVNIVVDETLSQEEKHQKGQVVSDNTNFKSFVRTYAAAKLNNVRWLTIDDQPQSCYGICYIKDAEVEKAFEERKTTIKTLLDKARSAQYKGKIDIAVKNYTWALALVHSLRWSGEPFYKDEDGDPQVLTSWIPEKLHELFSAIKVVAVKREDPYVQLHFTYNGKDVNSLDFTYFDGGAESQPCSVSDGIGRIELGPGTLHNQYQVQIYSDYIGQAPDPETYEVLRLGKKEILPGSIIFVEGIAQNQTENRSPSSMPETNVATSVSFTDVRASDYSRPAPMAHDEDYQSIMSKVLRAIQSKHYDDAYQYFTDDAVDIYRRLIKYGNASVVGHPTFSFIENNGEVIGRGAYMDFRFRNGSRKSFIEDMAFTFNADKKISNIAFGLGQTTEDDILANSQYPEQMRKILLQFIENYQTAYALKRDAYIESIFHDNAIIITGREIKDAGVSRDGVYGMPHARYEYTKLNKSTYLSRLRAAFRSNEFINITFDKCTVHKSKKGGEIYGVEIEQTYFSEHYSDHGYLFLQINLNNPELPLILVRTWQPEADPDFGLYGLKHFPIEFSLDDLKEVQ